MQQVEWLEQTTRRTLGAMTMRTKVTRKQAAMPCYNSKFSAEKLVRRKYASGMQ